MRVSKIILNEDIDLNYENASIDIDLNEPALRNVNVACVSGREAAQLSNNARDPCAASTPKNARMMNCSSGDDASTTEKHDCELGSQDGNTQDLECTSADRLVKVFGLDIDGVGLAVVPDGEPDTERVLGTESQAGDACFDERNTVLQKSCNLGGDTMQLGTESQAGDACFDGQNAALQKCSNLGGDTMQLDDEAQVQENTQPTGKLEGLTAGCSQSRLEDTGTGTIRTADLLASEIAGSWAVSTAPSVNGENESPQSMGDPGASGDDVAIASATATAALLPCPDGQASGSQASGVNAVPRLSKEQRVLNAMIQHNK